MKKDLMKNRNLNNLMWLVNLFVKVSCVLLLQLWRSHFYARFNDLRELQGLFGGGK